MENNSIYGGIIILFKGSLFPNTLFSRADHSIYQSLKACFAGNRFKGNTETRLKAEQGKKRHFKK